VAATTIDLNIDMKKILLITLLISTVSCDKTILEPSIASYTPQSLDEKAGTWKTYLLKKPEDPGLNLPTLISSKDYKVESLALLKMMDTLSQADKDNIAYWSAGAALRWNEIARELIAKYNIDTKVNEDGKYPIANPLLPNEYPQFPNANSLYASRVLAYLSVAQYDALVSTWYYKYKSNRPNPWIANTDIKPLLEKTDLPSFPSEDAALAAVSYKILVKMFPGEVEFLTKKATDAVSYRLKAGMNVNSDLKMGAFIGDFVSTKMLDYANLDGMAEANKQTVLAEQKTAATTLGIKKQWESLVNPVRPPLLPNFGSVKTWNFDLKVLRSLRPIPAILPETEAWKTEIEELISIGKSATKEQLQTAFFWNDGPNTYTPAGHWFRIASEECVKSKFSNMRIARTYALLGGTLLDAAIGCWETKYFYHLPRPQQYGIKTALNVPNSPGFTSEHATTAGAASTLLGGIFPYKSGEYAKMGRDVSDSRLYGGTHFKSDCELGLTHGIKIGSYALIRAEKDNSGLTIATK
jgi:membrane-associated phospholipid phosphatase